jgi:putative transposase
MFIYEPRSPMTLYRNQYRIESARCPNWDYTTNGVYFVTICTRDRVCTLGEVVNGEMLLSMAGAIVAEEWQKTPEIRSNLALDAWVVMPNHFHGIILIHNPSPPVETFRRNVSTRESRLQPNSLGSIIGQFKSICTKRIRASGLTEFGWQTRFYDHIIRDDAATLRIRDYILHNPQTWDLDKHHPPNP